MPAAYRQRVIPQTTLGAVIIVVVLPCLQEAARFVEGTAGSRVTLALRRPVFECALVA